MSDAGSKRYREVTAYSMYVWYTKLSRSAEKMKAYSIEFREKIVKAYEQGDTSVRKVAQRFDVSKAFVQKILKHKQTTGHVQPKKPGGNLKSVLHSFTTKLIEMVEKHPDSTLSEYCEYWLDSYQQSVSPSMMCRELKKQNMTRKKRLYGAVKLPQTECKF
jgi:transposase